MTPGAPLLSTTTDTSETGLKSSASNTSIPLAILFADIAGSTRLYETLGNFEAQRIVNRCFAVLTEVVQRYDGTVVKTIGDEVLCTFTTADLAARCAVDMQHTITAASSNGGFDGNQISMRTGFHFGLVVRDKGDVFGDAVNVASRVVDAAKATQILTTMQTVDLLSAEMRGHTRFVDIATLKGKQEEVGLTELIWDQKGVTVMDRSPRDKKATPQAHMQIRFHEAVFDLSNERPEMTMGRDQSNDVVVTNVLASRLHSRIEFRKDRFVLIDQSTNGTFVLMYGAPEVSLRRDEVVLRGSGIISLGHAFDPNLPESIHFNCED